jgi:hypothetical protein
MAMFGVLLQRDREPEGRLRIKLSDYRAVEAGEQMASLDMYDRTVELFGWPQAFVGPDGRIAYQ